MKKILCCILAFGIILTNCIIAFADDYSLSDIEEDMRVNVGSGSTLALRAVPKKNGKVLKSIKNKEIVHVIGYTEEQYEGLTWAKIEYKGTEGWCSNRYFEAIEEEPEEPEAPDWDDVDLDDIDEDMRVNVGSGSTLALRATPEKNGKVLKSIKNKETVHVIGYTEEQYEGLTWAKIEYKGIEGWCSNRYFEAIVEEPEEPEAPDWDNVDLDDIYEDMRVNVGSGSTLALRATPEKNGKVLKSIKNKEIVNVIGYTKEQYEGLTWARIRYVGVEGWSSNRYFVPINSAASSTVVQSSSAAVKQSQSSPSQQLVISYTGKMYTLSNGKTLPLNISSEPWYTVGNYFTVDGKKCICHKKVNKKYYIYGVGDDCKNIPYGYECTCRYVGSCGQCDLFARDVFEKCFGIDPANIAVTYNSSSDFKAAVKKAPVGSYIRSNNHSMIVLETSDSSITLYNANNNNGQIERYCKVTIDSYKYADFWEKYGSGKIAVPPSSAKTFSDSVTSSKATAAASSSSDNIQKQKDNASAAQVKNSQESASIAKKDTAPKVSASMKAVSNVAEYFRGMAIMILKDLAYDNADMDTKMLIDEASFTEDPIAFCKDKLYDYLPNELKYVIKTLDYSAYAFVDLGDALSGLHSANSKWIKAVSDNIEQIHGDYDEFLQYAVVLGNNDKINGDDHTEWFKERQKSLDESVIELKGQLDNACGWYVWLMNYNSAKNVYKKYDEFKQTICSTDLAQIYLAIKAAG